MQKILVTGGEGFIGHHLIKQLVDLNYEVTSLDSLLYTKYLNDISFSTHLRKERLNYNNSNNVFRLNEDIRYFNWGREEYDTVIYLSNVSRQTDVLKDPQLANDILVKGLLNALYNIETSHFIFFSTSMVYGDFNHQVNEFDSLKTNTLYGGLRTSGELIVQSICEDIEIPYTIIRPSAVYGPRDTNLRVVGKFIHNLINNESITLNGPNEVLDFTHVDDLINGVLLTINNPVAFNTTYNLTYNDSNPKTLLDLASILTSKLNLTKSIKINSRDINYPTRYNLSNEKARSELGFNPTIDLETGIEDTLTWARQFYHTLKKDIS